MVEQAKRNAKKSPGATAGLPAYAAAGTEGSGRAAVNKKNLVTDRRLRPSKR